MKRKTDPEFSFSQITLRKEADIKPSKTLGA